MERDKIKAHTHKHTKKKEKKSRERKKKMKKKNRSSVMDKILYMLLSVFSDDVFHVCVFTYKSYCSTKYNGTNLADTKRNTRTNIFLVSKIRKKTCRMMKYKQNIVNSQQNDKIRITVISYTATTRN